MSFSTSSHFMQWSALYNMNAAAAGRCCELGTLLCLHAEIIYCIALVTLHL